MEGTGGKRRPIAYGRMLRRGRIFAPMREGRAYVEIAREEELTAERNAGVPGRDTIGRLGSNIFLIWLARNPLKSPESDEGIQEYPSRVSWFGLV